MALDVVKIVRLMCARGLFHNDLKLANVLLAMPPNDPRFHAIGGYCVRLIDLGSMTGTGELPLVVTDGISAPELFQRDTPASTTSEVYSFSAFLFALFCDCRVPENETAARMMPFLVGMPTLHRYAAMAFSRDPAKRPPLGSFEGVLTVGYETGLTQRT